MNSACTRAVRCTVLRFLPLNVIPFGHLRLLLLRVSLARLPVRLRRHHRRLRPQPPLHQQPRLEAFPGKTVSPCRSLLCVNRRPALSRPFRLSHTMRQLPPRRRTTTASRLCHRQKGSNCSVRKCLYQRPGHPIRLQRLVYNKLWDLHLAAGNLCLLHLQYQAQWMRRSYWAMGRCWTISRGSKRRNWQSVLNKRIWIKCCASPSPYILLLL